MLTNNILNIINHLNCDTVSLKRALRYRFGTQCVKPLYDALSAFMNRNGYTLVKAMDESGPGEVYIPVKK